MTRILLAIAGLGLIVCIACFAGASALGGFSSDWHWRSHDGHSVVGHDYIPDRTAETREIAWTGADALDVDTDADVAFTQAPGPAKLTVSGPKDAVDSVRLEGSHLRSDDGDKITVTLSAPNVRSFSLNGDGSISIAKYDQDDLNLALSGEGHINADGKAKTVKVSISGDGDADLARLATKAANVSIQGDGHATIAPTDQADLNISGDGKIDLLSHPANVRSQVSGDGRIVQGAPAASESSRPTPARP
jgi:hypothetical protein